MFTIGKSWDRQAIMAADVSTKSTGWAFWGPWVQSPMTAEFKTGVVQPKSEFVYERIQMMNNHFQMLADIFRPDLLIIESGFADVLDSGTPVLERDRNASVMMKLAEARGAVMAAFRCPVLQISNTEWKRGIGIVTADELARDAVKQRVHEITCKLWDANISITKCGGKATYDESDAAAILAYVLKDLEFSGA